MENATKALLIAASVLIVIVLIGIGISILKSASDPVNQANDVGNIISLTTNSTANSTIASLKSLNKQSKEEFNHEYEQYVTEVNYRNFWGITSENFFRLWEMNQQKNGNERKVTIGIPFLDLLRDTNYLYYFLPRYDDDGYLIYLSYNGRKEISD